MLLWYLISPSIYNIRYHVKMSALNECYFKLTSETIILYDKAKQETHVLHMLVIVKHICKRKKILIEEEYLIEKAALTIKKLMFNI